jgi:hypothetical protein
VSERLYFHIFKYNVILRGNFSWSYSSEQVTRYCDCDIFTVMCEVRDVREARGGKSQLENGAGFFCDGFSLGVVSPSYAHVVAVIVLCGTVAHENL